MKSVERYQTRDRKEFDTRSQAQTHIHDKAVKELSDILREVVPFVDNPYGVATKIIQALLKSKAQFKEFESVYLWIVDYFESEEE